MTVMIIHQKLRKSGLLLIFLDYIYIYLFNQSGYEMGGFRRKQSISYLMNNCLTSRIQSL